MSESDIVKAEVRENIKRELIASGSFTDDIINKVLTDFDTLSQRYTFSRKNISLKVGNPTAEMGII